MERNRLTQLFVERTTPDRGTRPMRRDAAMQSPSTFVAMPPALWAELDAGERANMASIYQQAFLQAEADVRGACVERLLESIGAS